MKIGDVEFNEADVLSLNSFWDAKKGAALEVVWDNHDGTSTRRTFVAKDPETAKLFLDLTVKIDAAMPKAWWTP